MSTRTNVVILIAGNRGTGKTDYLKNIALAHPSPCVVIDTFDNPAWRNMKTWNKPEAESVSVQTMSEQQIRSGQMTGKFRRYFSSKTANTMELVDRYLYNSLVILEDATKYIGNRLTEDEKRFVLDSKQKNVDFIFTFHSLWDIPRDLVRISDVLVLFKTQEAMDSSLKSKYFHNEAVIAAFDRVRKHSSRYHHEEIQLGG